MYRAGQKLDSAVSDAQVVVVKAPQTEVTITCGGEPMLAEGEQAPVGATLDTSFGDGPAIGKRYAEEDLGLELLCTKAGEGALAVDGELLLLKGAKPLPSSD
jgi:hypothetical protein